MMMMIIFTMLSLASVQSLQLKPIATFIMDGGKKLAVAGERLVDSCRDPPLQCYGGSLSLAGASLRNCGDSIAQAGASMRNKFAQEFCADDCRESAVCLDEVRTKLGDFISEEAAESVLSGLDSSILDDFTLASTSCEMAGRIIGGGQGSDEDLSGHFIALSNCLMNAQAKLKDACEGGEIQIKGWNSMCVKFEEASNQFSNAAKTLKGEKVIVKEKFL